MAAGINLNSLDMSTFCTQCSSFIQSWTVNQKCNDMKDKPLPLFHTAGHHHVSVEQYATCLSFSAYSSSVMIVCIPSKREICPFFHLKALPIVFRVDIKLSSASLHSLSQPQLLTVFHPEATDSASDRLNRNLLLSDWYRIVKTATRLVFALYLYSSVLVKAAVFS